MNLKKQIRKEMTIDRLNVVIYEQAELIADNASDFVEKKIKEAINKSGFANIILATGSSQFLFLEALKKKEIDWKKITVFHLDEYKDISANHPASFRKYLRDRILNFVNPKKIYFLNGDAVDCEKEMRKYQQSLINHPIDVACIGIGENGHIAFNDPDEADFNDNLLVKLVNLDEACRRQQFTEGWFPSFKAVPKQALTLTIPAILNSKVISCVVPDQRKSKAVFDALTGQIKTSCPASILRTHPQTTLFLDRDSASKLDI